MKNVLVAVYALLLFSGTAFNQTIASTVYQKGSPAVVLIKTERGGGTGFVVSSSGIIATAFHVIENVNRISVKTISGDVYDSVDLLAVDKRKDLALIKIPGFDLPSSTLGNSNNLVPGEQLIVLGNPLAVDQLSSTISDGLLSGVRDLGDGFKVLQITAPISPGNSGGPVFNASGEVVGVVSFKLVKGESLNFAVPVNYLRGIIEVADPLKPLSSWRNSPSSPDAAETNPSVDITGTWKARDGQILQIRDRGKSIVVLNLTYPEVNTEAVRLNSGLVIGTIFNSGRFGGNKYYMMKLNDLGQLMFFFFDFKKKDSEEQLAKRMDERLKKRPDTVLTRID